MRRDARMTPRSKLKALWPSAATAVISFAVVVSAPLGSVTWWLALGCEGLAFASLGHLADYIEAATLGLEET
jgi:hypothetical protein